jgi:hypothetical protein
VKNRSKGFVLFVILLLVFPDPILRASGRSEKRTGTEAQTGEKDELPQWVRDMRRADIITFGVFPFTFFLASIIVDTYRFSQNNWDSQYAPWPVGSASTRTAGEHVIIISTAAGGAVLVAVADYFIQRAKRERAAQAAARTAPSDPIITRTPWPPGEEAEDGVKETPLPGIGEEPSGEVP